MSRVHGQCPACGGDADWYVSESIGAGADLLWSRALRCSHCGRALEEDFRGLPPPSVRDALVAQNGIWRLEIVNASERARAVAVLRGLLGLDLKTASAMLKGRDRALWSGTQVEAKWLEQHLERDGLRVELIAPPDR